MRSFRSQSNLTQERDTSEIVPKVPDADDTREVPVPSPIAEPVLTNKNISPKAPVPFPVTETTPVAKPASVTEHALVCPA